MSNLPAPIDPNLLPTLQHGFRLPYSQDLLLIELPLEATCSADFLAATPAAHPLELKVVGERIQVFTEGGTALGLLAAPPGASILLRLLEGGKRLAGRFLPETSSVGVWLQEL